MTDPRGGGPLSDAALDRAIERALAVDPSPAFVARVRHRVSLERPMRNGRGWFFAAVVASATPPLLLAFYLALPGRTAAPEIAARPAMADFAPVTDRGREQAPAGVAAERSVLADPHDGITPPLARRAARVSVPEPVTAARHVIVLPDIVISEAEVSAVLALSRRPVLEGEELTGDTNNRFAEPLDDSAPAALDVAELTIPSLAIEPLQLAARAQGGSE